MIVGCVIFFAFVGINKIKQENAIIVMGTQNKSIPALANKTSRIPILTPLQTPKPTFLITPPPTSTPIPIPTDISPTSEPLNAALLVSKYAQEYEIDEHILFTIGQCESGFNATSANDPYGGIYQFHYSTWASIRNLMGLDPNPDLRFNPEESIRTAAFKIAKDGTSAWPACSKSL